MTFFAPPTQSTDISKFFKYIPSDANMYAGKHPYHEFILSIPKTALQFNNYLKIKWIEWDLQILNNNYHFLKQLWEILINSNFTMNYLYSIDGVQFKIDHKRLPVEILSNWNDLSNAIPQFNPLYHEIDKLPHLKFRILNDYTLPNGFYNSNLDIKNILNHKNELNSINANGNLYSTFYNLTFTQNFKFTINIEYQNET